MTTPPPFYVTTPIYYVNSTPHLGTFYTTVVADALARYHRARGHETFFLTGLDEHGQKIERIAKERGLAEQAYCDGVAAKFQETWRAVGISNDDFIRTTDARHEAAVAEMWKRIADAGDIYEAEYDAMYCVGCEDTKSEDDVVVENDKKLCKIHLTPVEHVKEKNYFFRLSKYAPRLLEWYARPDSPVEPASRRNEVRAFVEGGLRDLSISRASVKWGIPVPGDPSHTVYVWIDALTNYLSVLGGPSAVAAGSGKGALWRGSHHLIAKDILRFHAVYWPALLWSAGLEPPHKVFCHGYLTVKGQKISKSMPATRVDPLAIASELGVDPLRYFVLREYAFGGDGDFTYESLFQRYESDLGNDLGNLLNRTIAMAHKFVGAELPARARATVAASASYAFAEQADAFLQACQLGWDGFAPQEALQSTWSLVREANAHIERTKPWALAKDPNDAQKRDELLDMLAVCCETLRWAALMIAPAMPTASREILRQLGREADAGTWPKMWGWPGGTLTTPQPVFPRVEPDRQAALIAKWVPAEAAPPAAPTSTKAAPAEHAPPAEIAMDDFAKIELRTAKVLSAERVPKADKLLKLELDVGAERRTVVSGIAAAYAPEALVGKTVIYLANLKPAKIRGVVSQGMILAAGDAEVLGLSALDRDVPPGTRVR
ncbi:MAG TPA: methionine--tRNA ligase [Polyangia bacterium]|nr:methionine--tRNA ligase [Polyangia bacterium]